MINYTWSYTSLKSFISCKRRFYYATIKGLRPKLAPIDLEAGSMFHTLARCVHEGEVISLDFDVKDSTQRMLLLCYLTAQRYKVFAPHGSSEVTGSIVTPEGISIKAIADVVTQDNQVVELKYTSSPEFYNEWNTAVQSWFLMNVFNVQEITYSLVHKPKIRIQEGWDVERIDMELSSFYKRYALLTTKVLTSLHYAGFAPEILHTLKSCDKEIRPLDANNVDDWPQNQFACYGNITCDFTPICVDGIVEEAISEYYI